MYKAGYIEGVMQMHNYNHDAVVQGGTHLYRVELNFRMSDTLEQGLQ